MHSSFHRPFTRTFTGVQMIKLCFHSIFSIAFFVIRFFILDAAASPAYAQAQFLNCERTVYDGVTKSPDQGVPDTLSLGQQQ